MQHDKEIQPVIYYPSGHMASDIHPLAISKGNYYKALNVNEVSQYGQTQNSRDIVLGNELGFILPLVPTQDKVFRIYLDSTTNDLRTLSFLDGNAVLITTAAWTPTVGNLAATFTSAATAIATALSGAGQTLILGALVPTSTNAGYFSLEITTIPFWDYSISLASNFATEVLPIITQEAIDALAAGQLICIGKYDLNGDLFVWSTPQDNFPTALNVTNAVNAAGLIRLTVSSTAGILNNSLVHVNGVLGTTEANGNWIVTVISATQIDLQGSVFTNAYVSGGIASFNVTGIGEIGIAQRDDNSTLWTYTTLLRSKEFNFRTLTQIKGDGERNAFLVSLYWIDGKNGNVPRVFYYKGPYMTNGALAYVNPLGEYDYGTISQETRNQINTTNSNLAFTQQLQVGGGITSGNWRYAHRFLTDTFSPGPIGDLTNPINVCVADVISLPSSAPIPAGGNNSYTATGKQNVFLITGIIPNLFKYVELIGLYYVDGSNVPVGTVIKREVLTQNTSQVIVHTGLETGITTFDVNNLLAVADDILTAEGQAIIDKRLVYGNITTSAIIDFTTYSQTFTHTLETTSRGSNPDVFGVRCAQTGTYRTGEYINPTNVNNYVGYMFNEIYRFGVKFKLKSGFITQTFWIDDIRIDLLANNNIANPTSNRRAANNIPTYDLTDSTADKVYVPFVKFGNIDLDFLVDGKKIRDLVDEVVFERVDLTDAMQEVRGSAIAVMGADMMVGFKTNNPPYDQNWDMVVNSVGGFFNYFIDFPFACGEWFYDIGNAGPVPNNVTYDFTAYNYVVPTYNPFYTPKRRFFSLYSPDFIFGNKAFDLQNGDTIINFGQTNTISMSGATASATGVQGTGGGCLIYSTLREFTGFTGATSYEAPTVPNAPNGIVISDAVMSGVGGSYSINGQTYAKGVSISYETFVGLVPQVSFHNPRSPIIATNQDLTINGTGNPDFASYAVQYYRFKGSTKFGNITTSKYVTTGSFLKITSTSGGIVSSGNVFGGDVFTQKSYLKHMMPLTSSPTYGSDTYNVSGFGGGMGYYTQNRVNTQMRNVGLTSPSAQANQWRYPANSLTGWLEPVETSVTPTYNTGYNIINGVIFDANFDPNLPYASSFPAREKWSDEKPENSVVDNFRNFLPLNFRDLELGNGEIVDIKNVNGELMSFQNRAFTFNYFNTDGILVTNPGEAVLGNAGVMTRRPNILSVYGTKHGHSVIIGKTSAGKATAAWINTDFTRVMRYEPSNGTLCLSETFDLQSFFDNNLRFAGLYFTPAHGEGIHGIWDDEKEQYIWTVRAYRKGVDAWSTTPQLNKKYKLIFSGLTGAFSSGENVTGSLGADGVINLTANANNYMVLTSATQLFAIGEVVTGASSGATATVVSVTNVYQTGDVVALGSTDFEGFPDFYESLVDNNVDNPITGLTTTPPTWEKVSFDNGLYYNKYTICFSEHLHGFTKFMTHLPKIYLARGKFLLSPRPIANQGRIYEHYTENSEYATWYNQPGATPVEQSEDAYIDGMFINYEPNIKKHFMNGIFSTDIVPFRVDFETKKQRTFVAAADFEEDLDQWKVGIKNDVLSANNSSPTPVNEQDTSGNFGEFIKVKLTMEKKVYQNFFNLIIKYRRIKRFFTQ